MRLSTASFCLIVVSLTDVNVLFPQTPVSGEVTGVWTLDGSPYIATGVITVPEQEELIIEPGVHVIFQPSPNLAQLAIDGKLIAKGSPENKIAFTPTDSETNPGAWGGILVQKTGNAELLNCTVMYADDGIRVVGGVAKITACEISHCEGPGIAWRGTFQGGGGFGWVIDSTIESNGAWGIECHATTQGETEGTTSPTIQGNVIKDNEKGGISLSAVGLGAGSWTRTTHTAEASPLIVNNLITGNGGYAVSGYSKGRLTQGNFSTHSSER